MTGTNPASPRLPHTLSPRYRLDPGWRRSLTDAAIAFLFSRTVVYVAVLIAPFVLPERTYSDLPPDVRFHTALPWVLDALVRWDGFHYLAVALEGYHVGPTPWQTNTPSLPLYPLLMWLTGGWAGEGGLVVAGLFIANVCLFAALMLLHRLVDEDFGQEVARRAALYLAVFPTAMFLSALYAEPLFLLLVLLFFTALRRQHWLAAGLFGSLAAVTRMPGAALAAVFIWEVLRIRGLSPARATPSLLPLLLFPLALLPLLAVQYLQTGDPISFLTAHQLWGRQFGTPLDQFTLTLTILSRPGQTPNFGLIFPLALIALFAAAGWRATQTQRSSHAVWLWVYFFIILASPSGTPFMSVSRFLLGAFPAFIVLAQWGRNRAVHHLYVVTATLLLFLSTAIFAQWYWVA